MRSSSSLRLFSCAYSRSSAGRARRTRLARPWTATSQVSLGAGGSSFPTASRVDWRASTASLERASTSWQTQSPRAPRSSPRRAALSLPPPRLAKRETHVARRAGAVDVSQDESSRGADAGSGAASVGRVDDGWTASSVQADSRDGKRTPRNTRRHVSEEKDPQSRSKVRRSVARAPLRTSMRGSATRWARPRSSGHHSSSRASAPSGVVTVVTVVTVACAPRVCCCCCCVDDVVCCVEKVSSSEVMFAETLPSARALLHSSRRLRAPKAMSFEARVAAAKATTQLTRSTNSRATVSTYCATMRSRLFQASSITVASTSFAAAVYTAKMDRQPDRIDPPRDRTRASTHSTTYSRTAARFGRSDFWAAKKTFSKGRKKLRWNEKAPSSSLQRNLSDSCRRESTAYLATSAFAWAPARAKWIARTRQIRSQARRGRDATFASATSTRRCSEYTRGRGGDPRGGILLMDESSADVGDRALLLLLCEAKNLDTAGWRAVFCV
mmetsp:Transcript_29721/g.95849  ORF Transcript_29721/g.95849 Transcript_29721/m.95849 type:complete len:498 (-) Transcript_29721:1823-3316(-)